MVIDVKITGNEHLNNLFECPDCGGMYFNITVGGITKCACMQSDGKTIGCGWSNDTRQQNSSDNNLLF